MSIWDGRGGGEAREEGGVGVVGEAEDEGLKFTEGAEGGRF
jgi:hypothetical protein